MQMIGYYIYYYIIHLFVAALICGVAGAVNSTLGGFFIFISFFALFGTAYSSAKKKVHSLSMPDRGTYDSSNNISIRFTTSYSDYDDEDYDNSEKNILVSPRETIKLSGLEIEGALFYTNTGGTKSRLPHVIPQKLKVSPNGSKESLNYWPSYSEVSTGNRYQYLKWLSEGREDPDIDTGFLFIYFYGLEWRIIKDERDYQWIAEEVIRLLSIYENNSFQNYAKNLLTYISLNGLKELEPETIEKIKEIAINAKPYSTMAESGLMLVLEKTEIVNPTILFSQIPNFENVSRSKVPGKVGSIFFEHLNNLLNSNVENYCKEATITDRTFNYYAASSRINNKNLKGKHINIPVKTQRKLAKAWNKAIEDLRQYSNRIDKDSKEKLFTLLPEELKKEMDHPLQDVFGEIFNQKSEQVLKFGKLAEQCGFPYKEKYTLKECLTLSSILLDNQISIEPDPDYFRKSFKYDDDVCVFKDKINPLKGPNYSTVSMLMDLGISLAHADGNYDAIEDETIGKAILHRFCSNDESLRIRASKRLLIYRENPPRTVGLIKKLSERLKRKELISLGKFLLEVAYADGNYKESEEKLLKKAFKGLGIEDSYEQLKEDFIGYEGNSVIRVKAQRTESQGEGIPREAQNNMRSLEIDQIKLKKLEEETTSVQNALSEIFKEEEGVTSPEFISQETTADLNSNERKFLDMLLEFPKIERDELRNMAKEHGFMVGQIIDKINNWAEEVHGDYLIFDEGDYIIEQALILGEKESA